MTDKEKQILKLKKRYLNLMYRINKFQVAGNKLPDELIEELADIKRIIYLMSKALN